MVTITIRLKDEKHKQLKMLAKKKRISLNKLIDELSTIAISDFNAKNSFLVRKSRGSAKTGIKLLNKLDVAQRKKK